MERNCFSRATAPSPSYTLLDSLPPTLLVARVVRSSSRDELERATKTIPGCSKIVQLEAPGGGEYVKLIDPAGHVVLLVHGQTKSESSPPPVTLEVTPTNLEFDDQKPRKVTFQRFNPGPAPVHRWGHYGVTYPQGAYQEMYDWYTGYLALAPSDVV